MLRYNTDTLSFEGFNGIVWGGLGGGSGGDGDNTAAPIVLA